MNLEISGSLLIMKSDPGSQKYIRWWCIAALHIPMYGSWAYSPLEVFSFDENTQESQELNHNQPGPFEYKHELYYKLKKHNPYVILIPCALHLCYVAYF